MEYNEEQRAIIRRIGETSIRFDAAIAASRAAQEVAGRNIANVMGDLITATYHLSEIVRLNRECGDAFREFLDTL